MLRRLLLSSTIALLPSCSDDSGSSGAGDSSGDTGSDDGSAGTSQDGGSGTEETDGTGNTSSSGGTSTGDTSQTGATSTGETGTTSAGTGSTGITGDTSGTTGTGETETATGTTTAGTGTPTTSGTGATTSGGLTCGDLNEAQCLAANGCMGLQGQQYVPADNQSWCLDSTPVFVYCTPVGDPCLPATQTVCIGNDTYEAWSQCELPDGVTVCSPPQGYTGPC